MRSLDIYCLGLHKFENMPEASVAGEQARLGLRVRDLYASVRRGTQLLLAVC